MNYEKLKAQLIYHEGLRLKPYRDTVGKLTIGVGRNLDDVGISKHEAMMLLDTDIAKAESDAQELIHNYDELGDVRQRVVVDMAFNLGRTRLRKFKKMIAAIEAKLFTTAAREMMNSRWYTQVGRRGERLVAMMKTGMD